MRSTPGASETNRERNHSRAFYPASALRLRNSDYLQLQIPGQYCDVEFGQNYNYFRDYDPTVGRYAQSDPIGLEAGRNTFSYVSSQPLSNFDPMGLQAATLSPGWSWQLPGEALFGACRSLGIAVGLAFYSGKGDACSDDPRRERNECRTKDDEFCFRRWEAEDTRCNQWVRLGNRAVYACKVRAADRRALCQRNGGSPNPDEPPEYNPFVDYPR